MENPRESEGEAFSLSLLGKPENVKLARRFLACVCRSKGIEDTIRDPLGLVLTELLNNAIEHGEGQSDLSLDIRIEISDKEVRIRIKEPRHGEWKGADGEALVNKARSSKPDETQFRGRGLFLVFSYMDDVKVHSDDGTGTVVEVVKFR